MSIQISCPSCKSSVLVAQPDLQTTRCTTCGYQFSLSGGREEDGYTLQVVGEELPEEVKRPRFSLVELIGEGSFGSVWKTWDAELQRHVALKLPRVDNLSPRELTEFLRDAKSAAQLDHVNIVRVFDIAQVDGQTAIVAELVTGSDLKTWLLRNRPTLTFHQTADLVAKISDGLQHAHSRGVIHRDLKPGNVMLTEELQPKVIDFGMARREVHDATLTYPGLPLGTPTYMPPEQARGEGSHADRRSDVYSLGIILFEMLTGSVPFRGASTKDLLLQQIENEPPRPTQLNQSIPASLETICLKCLRKEPERRFQTAQEVADELRRWLAGKPIHSRPIGWIERFWMLCRRNPAHSSAYAAAALVCVIVLIVAFVRISVARDQERSAKIVAQNLAATNKRLAEQELGSRLLAEKSRDQAFARLTDAREAVDLWLTTVGEHLRYLPGVTREREQLLALAEQDYAKFASQASDDRNLELERGRALLRLGQVRRELRKTAEAHESFDQALQVFDRISHREANVDKIDQLSQQAIAGWCDANVWIGLLAQDAGEFDAANAEFQKAIERLDQHLQSKPSPRLSECLAVALFNRGSLQLQRQNLAEAQTDIEKANRICAEVKGVDRTSRRLDSLAANGLGLLSAAAYQAGQLKTAERHASGALQVLAQLLEVEPANVQWEAQRGQTLLQRAAIMQQLGREFEEQADITAAISSYESITKVHPDLHTVQQALAVSLIDAARLSLANCLLDEAQSFLTRAEQPLQAIQASQNPIAEQLAAHRLDVLGQVQIGLGETAAGQKSLSEAVALFEDLVAANPDFPALKVSLALAMLHRAQGLEANGDAVSVDLAYKQATDVCNSITNQPAVSAEDRYVAAYTAMAFADYCQRTVSLSSDQQSRQETAQSESRRAAKLWNELVQSNQPVPEHLIEFAKFLLNHSGVEQRNPAQALELLVKLESTLSASPTLHQLKGFSQLKLNQLAQAEQSLKQAITLRRRPDAKDDYYLCLILHGIGRPMEARESLKRATEWHTKHAPALPELVRLRKEATELLDN